MLLTLFLILLSFILLPSPLFYSLGLLGVVCVCFFWSLYYSLFHTLLSLLILILYIGAMMVLISYVSATTPNFLPVRGVFMGWGSSIGLLGLLGLFVVSEDSYYYASSLGGSFSDFFFMSSGIWVFWLLVAFMFIMLLISSFLVVQKGTFRSVYYVS